MEENITHCDLTPKCDPLVSLLLIFRDLRPGGHIDDHLPIPGSSKENT